MDLGRSDQKGRRASRLLELGYSNVGIRAGDGSRSWAEHAPFDKILLIVATERQPPALLDQLMSRRASLKVLGPYALQCGGTILPVRPRRWWL
jgi:hypothetical protein